MIKSKFLFTLSFIVASTPMLQATNKQGETVTLQEKQFKPLLKTHKTIQVLRKLGIASLCAAGGAFWFCKFWNLHFRNNDSGRLNHHFKRNILYLSLSTLGNTGAAYYLYKALQKYRAENPEEFDLTVTPHLKQAFDMTKEEYDKLFKNSKIFKAIVYSLGSLVSLSSALWLTKAAKRGLRNMLADQQTLDKDNSYLNKYAEDKWLFCFVIALATDTAFVSAILAKNAYFSVQEEQAVAPIILSSKA